MKVNIARKIDSLERSVRKHISDKKKLNAKIHALRKHNSECMIYRMSALGCMCGLVKKG
jgi:hypothetical protein